MEEMTVVELQRGMASGRFTAAGLVEFYKQRIHEIDQHGSSLKAVIELNPDALTIATTADWKSAKHQVGNLRYAWRAKFNPAPSP